ncbi:hypothetical protein ACN38_g1264 [Penicillium nordicum]|uniref:Uncharacterized protein n=1 Tax=Penicillium nordicum TaxID=229535 RepID=A0A0N0RZW8_9EURO|nr:hypothetical protein ACN38_g1264 [Penicillium nordicum]
MDDHSTSHLLSSNIRHEIVAAPKSTAISYPKILSIKYVEHHSKHACLLFASLLVCYRLSLCSDGFNRVYEPLGFKH